jgi:uncharacterized protein (DUF2141 family)
MRRLLEFRREIHSHRRKQVLAGAIVSCLVVVVALFAIARYRTNRQPQGTNMATVSKTVNLWDAATTRGEQPGSLQSVLLPAALVKLTIVLPRLSAPGNYAVAVTRDQSGDGVLAQGSATTMATGQQETISVELDLRRAEAGTYFLSTIHEQDQASYYYPLQIW